jgi:hypothetical protein
VQLTLCTYVVCLSHLALSSAKTNQKRGEREMRRLAIGGVGALALDCQPKAWEGLSRLRLAALSLRSGRTAREHLHKHVNDTDHQLSSACSFAPHP